MSRFHFDSQPVHAEMRRRMLGRSYREDPACPSFERLRVLTVAHHDFRGGVRSGTLVVALEVVDDLREIFARLFELGFPIACMRPVDDYGGDDAASMAANNTSAFNFRRIAGTEILSHHALGIAVDINPVQNPMIVDGRPHPPAGAPYMDRRESRPGMIVRPGEVVAAFEAQGWHWGGDWPDLPDHHHFSRRPRDWQPERAARGGA